MPPIPTVPKNPTYDQAQKAHRNGNGHHDVGSGTMSQRINGGKRFAFDAPGFGHPDYDPDLDTDFESAGADDWPGVEDAPETISSEAFEVPPAPEAAPRGLAREPDLIAAIQRDIATVGVVGEGDNALLAYVAFTSRLLDDPLAVVTRGGSSTGKSTLLNLVARLFPDETKVRAMELSKASLFNGAPDMLTHKILISGERKHSTDDATRDQNSMIRQLLSEKRIERSVSVKEGCKWVTEHQVRDGPVAYAESTTAGTIFAEDLNRMLQLYLDDSEDQNRNVMLAVAGKYDLPPEGDEDPVADAIARHHEFQRSLKPKKVAIPFARALAGLMPAEKPECRRLIQQALSVVEALALLHQHHRPDVSGRVVATLDDYETARRLLLGPVNKALGVTKGIAEFRRLRQALTGEEFTSNDALKLFDNVKPTRDRVLKDLCGLGLLRQVAPGKSHTPARWRWTGKTEDVLLLPSAESLSKEVSSAS